MTNPNLTSINIILDCSGSMTAIKASTLEGLNSFIETQKKVPGDVIMTLVTFNTEPHTIFSKKPLKEVSAITNEEYDPQGGTALLDALGLCINTEGSYLSSLKEEDRPSKVLFVIITDGQENYSKEFKKSKIKEMIIHQQEKYSWEFIYLGANVDAISEANEIGIRSSNSVNYSANYVSVKSLYNTISDSTTRYRSSDSKSFSIKQEDIK
jgi:uncharacterized protein YegL